MRPEAACGAAEALALNEAGQFLAIARILRPQGRKGEVAAEILTDFPARFHLLQSVFLEVPGQTPQPVNVESSWPHKGRIILKFSGIDSIETASSLRGLQVFIPWEQRAPLPPHHYYLCELHGCRVIWERRGQEIGTVTEVESTGGVDVLHVERPDGKGEVLIPLAQEICTRIDLASRTIVIDPPENLLDLNE
ncbi:MAG: ribosome maturation factor RimM [Terriglobia bacterium]|jgi:16S rRNA processing protein RimM